MDLNDITEFLLAAARSVGAELTSPWFYLQLGLILAAAGIALRRRRGGPRRVDVTSLAMGWPAPLRLMLRVLVASASTAVFALLMAGALVMLASTWPSRSYLIAVAASLATAWLVIRLVTSVIRNAVMVRLVSVSAWIGGRAEHPRPAAADHRRARLGSLDLGGLRLSPLLLIKLDALLIAGAVAGEHRQQLRRRPDQPLHRPDAVDPGADRQADPHDADGGRGRDRARARSASISRRWRSSPARSASASASACRRSSPISSAASSCWPTSRSSRAISSPSATVRPHQRDEHALYFGRRRRRPRIPDPERGPGDAEGRQLDLHRQEHAGEGQIRHQLRRRSAAGLRAGDRDRRGRAARHQEQAAELHPHRIRRARHEILR